MSVLSQPTPQISVGPPPTLTYQVSVTNGQAYTLTVYQTINGADTVVVSPTAYTGTGSLQTYTFTSPVTSYSYYTRVLIGATTTNSTSVLYYSPYQGPQGVQGNPGAAGQQGPLGPVGPQGPQGLQGVVSVTNYVTCNSLITSGTSSGTVNAHSTAVLTSAGALSGITTITAGTGSSSIGGVTLSNGYVAIGATVGTYTLDVTGTIRVTSTSLAATAPDGGANHGLMFTSTKTPDSGKTAYSMALGVDSGTGYGYINAAGNNIIQPLLLQSRGGGVGINRTTAPSYELDVSGTIRATTDVTVTSDVRSKTNIDTIINALSKVNSMRGVSYTLKTDPSVRKIGVIAQEIEQIIPEVVSTDASPEQNKAVAYGNITAVLIEAIKELTQRLEVLEKMKG